jgi:hypothetical protein
VDKIRLTRIQRLDGDGNTVFRADLAADAEHLAKLLLRLCERVILADISRL